MADSPHSHGVALDLVTNAIVTYPDLPQANQRAPKAFAISGRFSHQPGLDRPNDSRTEALWDAREIFGSGFRPIHYRIATTHRLLDPEPPLQFRVRDRSSWVLPALIDDLFQGRVFQKIQRLAYEVADFLRERDAVLRRQSFDRLINRRFQHCVNPGVR